MIDEPKPSSAVENLAYIRRVMEDTRRAITMRGDSFILWGIVVLAGLIGTYVFDRIQPPDWAWIPLWGGLMLIGWAATAVLVRREKQRRRSSTFAGRMMGALWGACGIAIVIVVFVGVPLGVIPGGAIAPVIWTLVGVGVFMTGTLMGMRWVRNLAFGWWAGAVAGFFWQSEVQFLISAIVIILFYIVPGFVLNAQARKHYRPKRA